MLLTGAAMPTNFEGQKSTPNVAKQRWVFSFVVLGKELVDEKRGTVVYQPAAGMIADGFTKAYDPAEHKIFARIIQGEEIADIKVQTTGGR